jgi:phosphoserine phosphatase RsbU/P
MTTVPIPPQAVLPTPPLLPSLTLVVDPLRDAPLQDVQQTVQETDYLAASESISNLRQQVLRLQREQNQTQELLAALSFALRSFKNLKQFLHLIPLVLSRFTEADAAAIVFFKSNGQISLEQLHCHETGPCPNIKVALDTAIQGFTQTQAAAPAARLSRTELLDHQLASVLPPGLQWFGSTILVKNQTSEQTERGRLYIFSQAEHYDWNESRQQLMQFVADQTAVKIENEELTLSLRQKERLDRELEIGAEIQERLLPSKCPHINGIELAAACKTADRVGGDYYDFIPIAYGQPQPHRPENLASARWGLVIGDVMGKGVPAGLIMTMTRGMLRAEVYNGHRPARILQHLNRVMYTDLATSNRFVTLFYAEYNPLTRLLAYSNAAHHPPLLWQANTQTIHRLNTFGMLVGLDTQSQYQEAEVRLQPGDTIIFYTDGFTDAVNPQGRRFDEENLIAAFQTACTTCQTPQDILQNLFGRVQEFAGLKAEMQDDMTLIVFKVAETSSAGST